MAFIAQSQRLPLDRVDWDLEWGRAWKPHRQNPWFDYQWDVLAARATRIDLAAEERGRALKTDAFEEACGLRSPTRAFGRMRWVLMDVSPRILEVARTVRDAAEPAVCATDARALGFRSGSFDLVLSTSTLDHFDDEQDIGAAFASIRDVLRPGGRFLITLDNPANPILRVRHAIHSLLGPVSGLIPFPIGRTISRGRLVSRLEQKGFRVYESGYAVHTPRLLGLWLGEWAARRGRLRLATSLRRVFGNAEWVLGRLPTRRWTGHFVVADCRRSVRVVHTDDDMPRLVRRVFALEHRVRCAYLRRVPPPLLARVDPLLNRGANFLRRTAAAPLYLANELVVWTGPSRGGSGTVATWGRRPDVERMVRVLFDGQPHASPRGSHALPAATRALGEIASSADLLVAVTTPAIAPGFRRRGYLIVPGAIRYRGVPADLLAAQVRPGKSLASDLALIRRAGYRAEVWSYTPARSRTFYERYLIPHAVARFGDEARVPTFEWSDRFFAAGTGFAVRPPDREEPHVVAIGVIASGVLWFARLGTRDGDADILRRGGLAALYHFLIRFAHERGYRLIDAGYAVPWRADGVVHYKWKWGFRPAVDPAVTLEYAIRIARPDSGLVQRLLAHRVMAREGDRLVPISGPPRPAAGSDPGDD